MIYRCMYNERIRDMLCYLAGRRFGSRKEAYGETEVGKRRCDRVRNP